MSYHIGIIGAGNISETHARAVGATPGTELVAVWGGNRQKAARLAEKHGAPAYTDIADCVRHRPLDVVLIGSPSGLHAEHAGLAARHGLHVLVEKPLDINTARIDTLLDECERAGVQLGVFYQDRAAPGLQWLRRLILSGGLGNMILASARVKWYRPLEYYADSRWRGTRALDGGGALMNQGSHTVDLLLWLLGDVGRVYARTRTALHAIEVEDCAIAALEFASGALATLEATTAAYPGYPRRLELTGSAGTVNIEHDRVTSIDLRTAPHESPPRSEERSTTSATSATMSNIEGHRAVLQDFLRALETGSRPLCDGREGRRSVEAIEAMYRSAASGEAVSLQRRDVTTPVRC